MRGVLALIVFVFCWAACAGLPPGVERPRAEVRDVSIEALSLAGMRGELMLDVFNPNAFAVPLGRVDWELAIGDGDAAQGSFALDETIPARASAPVAIALDLDGRDAMQIARRVAAGERTYTLRGVMHFATVVGEIPVRFTETGDLAEALERVSLGAVPGAHADAS
jgi:LEA14-like dessication related protein